LAGFLSLVGIKGGRCAPRLTFLSNNAVFQASKHYQANPSILNFSIS
jgi:hypothetical protein